MYGSYNWRGSSNLLNEVMNNAQGLKWPRLIQKQLNLDSHPIHLTYTLGKEGETKGLLYILRKSNILLPLWIFKVQTSDVWKCIFLLSALRHIFWTCSQGSQTYIEQCWPGISRVNADNNFIASPSLFSLSTLFLICFC